MKLEIWPTLRAAAGDLAANKALAIRIYAVYIAVAIITSFPSFLWPSMPFTGLLPSFAVVVMQAWMLVCWTEWVIPRARGGAAPPFLFWPALQALVKLYALLFLLAFAGILLDIEAISLAHLSAAVSGAAAVLALFFFAADLVLAVRLTLVPARAAIGEGTSLKAAWRASKENFWRLFGIDALLCATTLISGIAALAIFSFIAVYAVHEGWIAPPADMTPPSIANWIREPPVRLLLLAGSLVMAPVNGAIFFLFSGTLIRAAVPGGAAQVLAPDHNPWSF